MNVFSKSRKDRKQGRGSASGKGGRKDVMAARKRQKAPKKTYRLRTWLQSGRLSRLMVIFMVVVSLGILGVALFREQGILAAEIVSRLHGHVRKDQSRREICDLGAVIEETLLLVDHERRRRGIRVAVYCEPNLPPINADRVQIEQILLNLLRNAFHAVEGAERRKVWMRIRRAGADRVCMVVEDSGRGLAPERCERVFETFYSTKPNGLGVGLAISRSLAESHGGRMWAPVGGVGRWRRCPVRTRSASSRAGFVDQN